MKPNDKTQTKPSRLSDRLRKLQAAEGPVEGCEGPKTTPSRRSGRRSARRRKWKLVAYIGVPALLVFSGAGFAAISSITTNFSGIHGNNFVYDESTFTVTSQGMDLKDSALAGAGTSSGSPIEMASPNGAANTALSAGDWFYEVTVVEAAVDSLSSGAYKVELFVDGTSKGALYMEQGTADATASEGVAFQWSLGSSLEGTAAYVVKISAA